MGREQLRKSLCVVLLLQFVQEGRSVSDFKGHTELPYQDKLPHIQGRIQSDHTWCDEVLGCLHTNSSWYSYKRPNNPLPDTRKFVNTKFYLNTRCQPEVNQLIIVTPENLSKTSFKASKPTKFIVHGYMGNAREQWVKEMTSALLNYGDYNVIRVDWEKGAKRIYYQSAANSRVVGLEIGHFVAQVNLDPRLVHCIGFTLGAHVCGYGGERIPRLWRITGLDPAGPYFTRTPKFVHLDPTDASFVDVIHTDANIPGKFGFGTHVPMGNINFFPNSGTEQPGCTTPFKFLKKFWKNKRKTFNEIIRGPSCSNSRAVWLFIESLKVTSSCSWLAHICKSYEDFKKGHCLSCGKKGRRCAYMGIRADEYVAKYRKFARLYLDTDKDAPYCMNHYGVSFVTSNRPGWNTFTIGRLYMSIRGVGGKTLKRINIFGNHTKFEFGKTIRNLFFNRLRINNIQRIALKWEYNPGYEKLCVGLNYCKRFLYFKSLEITPITHYPDSVRLAYTATFCRNKDVKIRDGQVIYFNAKNTCPQLSSYWVKI